MAKKVIALNTINITIKPGEHGDKATGKAPVKPEIMEIKPGTVFMAEDEPAEGKARSQYDELMAAKAIRDWSEKDERVLRNLSHVVGEYNTDTVGDDAALRMSGASATNDGTAALTGVKSDGPNATKTESGSVSNLAPAKPGETTTAAVESTNDAAKGASSKKDAVNSAV